MKEIFIKNYCEGEDNVSEKDLDFINRVFSNILIEKCRVNLLSNRLFEQMNPENYTSYVKDTMLSLTCQSVPQALIKTNLLPNRITHLVFGTMTVSIRAPSLDIHIIHQLKLNIRVKRLNIEAMGCLTGFQLTGLCNDLSSENESNIVLLIVCDIRSGLGNQLTLFSSIEFIDKSNVPIFGFFRDAVSAIIFSQKSQSSNDPHIVEHQSMMVPDSLDRVLLQEFNDGTIHLFLHKQQPDSLFATLPTFINTFLSDYNININQCLFAVHTGGPKLIKGIQKYLNLEAEQLFSAWYAMKNYDNLNDCSDLVVLEHLLHHRQLIYSDKTYDICFPSDFFKYIHIVGLSFGSELDIECVIFHF